MEANPDSLDASLAQDLVRAGVTRLSIGAQSLDDDVLAGLGRCHDAADVRRAVVAARRARVRSLGLDLMCGGPGEDDRSWRSTVEEAVALGPDHLSLYALTLERDTPLWAAAAEGRIALPDEDEVADRLAWAAGCLAEGGFRRYEIANWARPGHECRHNLNYWRYGRYVGLGAGAVSRTGTSRMSGPSSTQDYVEATAAGSLVLWEREPLDRCVMWRERVMLGLRLARGIPAGNLGRVGRACGAPDVPHRSSRWIQEGLLSSGGGRLTLTERGMSLANRVLVDLTIP